MRACQLQNEIHGALQRLRPIRLRKLRAVEAGLAVHGAAVDRGGDERAGSAARHRYREAR